MELDPLRGTGILGTGSAEAASGWQRAIARAVETATRTAASPRITSAALVAINLLLIGLFIACGELLFGDPAEMFRELMPGTWLSIAQLVAVAVTAWAIHREVIGPRLRLDNLWGISVVAFLVFAFDEATQLTIFLGDGLAAAGALAPAGFRDLDAFLLTILLVAGGAAMLRYARALVDYPAALVLIGVGVVVGGASQTLDAVLASTTTEFVVEESLKLIAESLVVGGYLLVLAHAVRGRDARDDRPGLPRPV